jgi:hypothetical protein
MLWLHETEHHGISCVTHLGCFLGCFAVDRPKWWQLYHPEQE